MGGGLIQLKYLGSEADFFIGNPQISFFKTVFKSYANFSQELIDVNFESKLDFNKSTYANIPIHADLINKCYLNLNLKLNVSDIFDLTLKEKFSSTKSGVLYEFNSINNEHIENNEELFLYNYIYSLSNHSDISSLVISEINSLSITESVSNLYNSNNHKIDLSNVSQNKLYYSYNYNSESYNGIIYIRFIKEDLTKLINTISFEIDEFVIEKHNTDWLLAYNKIFNNNETLNKINNQLKSITPKMFNKNIQLYIPLRFFFTKDTTTVLPLTALYRSDINIKITTNKKEDIFICNSLISNVDFNKACLSINYIHLDTDEQNYFKNNNHKLLIEQVQHQETNIINGVFNNIDLHFTYLSKYILWKLPYKYILNRAKLIFNNNDLFYEQYGEYFHLLQLMEHGLGNIDSLTRMEENTDTNGTYYLYSFCLYPALRQPSGLCNMSRIDDKFLQLETSYINESMNNNVKIPVDVFSVNYNFLYIEHGKCKLEF